MKKKLKVLPLGGVGEIGMNLMVLQYGNEAVALDCGIMFSDDHLPGIDLVVPDVSYLLKPELDLKGVVLTHGHLDHIGAVPFLLRDRNVPVYGSKFTLELVRAHLKEHELLGSAKLHLVKEGAVVRLGPFSVEFVRMSHSIADALGLIITTPEGTVVFTGDYKLDASPVDGRSTDMERFKRAGDEGVLLLMSDSTNVEVPGPSPSESSVRADLERLVDEARGWVIVACFASHIPRLKQLFEIARQCRRRVCLAGRSVIENVGIARSLGYLDVPDALLVEPDGVGRLPRDKVMIISTGTQGEIRAALSRMALDEHKEIKIRPGDRVIFSSRMIPGNERAIYSIIDHLYRRGAEVFTGRTADVHVSGHGFRGDMEVMLGAVRPKYFVPVHGEYRHLVLHAALAKTTGVDPQRVMVLEDGCGLEFSGGEGRFLPPVPLHETVVDGAELVDIESSVLKDRRLLSATGMVVAVLVFDRHSGNITLGPELFSRGLAEETYDAELLTEARKMLENRLEEFEDEFRRNDVAVQEEIRLALRRFFKNRIDRKPVVIPIVLEV